MNTLSFVSILVLVYSCNNGGPKWGVDGLRRRWVEQDLKRKTFGENDELYDKTSRPVVNSDHSIMVRIGLVLYHILETNEKSQTLTTLVSVQQQWKDHQISWDPKEYNNLTKIRKPSADIWTPDIFITNLADGFGRDFLTSAIIQNDGKVLWMYPSVIKTYCSINVKFFPFDIQKCSVTFMSWSHDGDEIDLSIGKATNAYRQENQEWRVVDLEMKRNEKKYPCCEALYPDITVTIHMARRSTFYVFNLIAPCCLIYMVSFLAFFLPVDSGEKINLEITIFLVMVVFMMIIGELMPPTPDYIPLLGLYITFTMVMLSISVLMAVLVTNVYFRKDDGPRPPKILRRFFCIKDQVELLTEPEAEEEPATTRPIGKQFMSRDNFRNLPAAATFYNHPNGFIDGGKQVPEETVMRWVSKESLESAKDETKDHIDLKEKAIEKEWKDLADKLDRFFLVIHLIMSFSGLLGLYSQIPMGEDH